MRNTGARKRCKRIEEGEGRGVQVDTRNFSHVREWKRERRWTSRAMEIFSVAREKNKGGEREKEKKRGCSGDNGKWIR